MSNKELTNLFSKFIKPYKKQQFKVFFFAFLHILMDIAIALLFKEIIDNALRSKRPVYLIILCLCYLLSSLCKVIFTIMKEKNASTIGESVIKDLREQIISHYHRLSTHLQERTISGNILTLCIQDTLALKDIFATRFSRNLTNIISIVCIISVMLFLDWQLTFFALIGLPVSIFFISIYGFKLPHAEKKVQTNLELLNQRVIQSIKGNEVIKHLNANKQMESHFSIIVNNFRNAILTKNIIITLKDVTSNFFSTFFLSIFIVVGGFFSFNHQNASPGILLTFIVLVPTLFNVVNDLILLRIEIKRSVINIERIQKILALPIELAGTYKGQSECPEIKLNNVYFGYDNRNILNDINILIKPKEKVAIIGTSGSGKTTLGYILSGLYIPTSGQVLYDNKNIKIYTETAKYNMLGMMEQSFFLFDDTITNNIYNGNNAIDERFIQEKAQLAMIHEDILKMPNGYNTELNDKNDLSGGQKQRLAFARILYQRPNILILDEPTSNLDMNMQKDFIKIIENDLKENTVIFITHNNDLINIATHIIELNEGQIVKDIVYNS